MSTSTAFHAAVEQAEVTLTALELNAKGADELSFCSQVRAALSLTEQLRAGTISAKAIADDLVNVPVDAIQFARVKTFLDEHFYSEVNTQSPDLTANTLA